MITAQLQCPAGHRINLRFKTLEDLDDAERNPQKGPEKNCRHIARIVLDTPAKTGKTACACS